MSGWQDQVRLIVDPAVARSQRMWRAVIAPGALAGIPALLCAEFNARSAVVVADGNTMAAAGEMICSVLEGAGVTISRHVFPATPRPKASVENGEAIRAAIDAAGPNAVPIAVGSGVLNDLVKFAAHGLDRDYLCVATAASMDGYTSAGAPLVDAGFKHTIACRPPAVLLADLDVIAAAPPEMTGWGYGDMAGKIPAGADWIVADALGVEPIDDVAWPLVQDNLRGWLAAPGALMAGDRDAVAGLFAGLAVSGLAMEFHGTSRPASGSDHQIAHLWEMENRTYKGLPVAHGACVALGSLTVLSLYDWLLRQDLSALDIDRALAVRPDLPALEAEIARQFDDPEIIRRAAIETRSKFADEPTQRRRLDRIVTEWPALRRRLSGFLIPTRQMAAMLAAAGAPTDPAQVGISRQHHHDTLLRARFIRRRYTVLDLLADTGLLDRAIVDIFGPDGAWRADDRRIGRSATAG